MGRKSTLSHFIYEYSSIDSLLIFATFAQMKKLIIIFAVVALISCKSSSSESQESTSSETIDTMDAAEETATTGVLFSNIVDGATLTSPFVLEMGVKGMEVEPKGTPREGWGHHHLLINDDFIAEGLVIVADDTHIHYGGGQTSDSLSLEPGDYKLTLQLADGMHVSYGQALAKTINVSVL
jgi:hypothetical protein